jgi:hypothetical protein
MFVHAVYFTLRGDLTPADHARFVDGLQSLRTIGSVTQAYIGVPAPTDRPVIERGYSYALVLVFVNQTAHDAYQVDPVHDRFREECSPFWERVRIYDSVSESEE